MKQAIRKIIFGSLLIFILGISITSVAVAETTVSYTIDPEEPKRQSDVTVTLEVEDEDITEIYLEMRECRNDLCYDWNTNVSMVDKGDNTYDVEITLEYDDATYFSLRPIINRNGEWEILTIKEVDIDVTSSGNGDGDNGTPGFEMVLLLISIVMGTAIIKRKRL